MSGGDQGIYMSRLCPEQRNQVSGECDGFFFLEIIILRSWR